MEIDKLIHRSSSEVDGRISHREVELIKFRDNRTVLVFTLLSGETFLGAIRWYDDRALRIVQDDRSEVTIHLAVISYYRTPPHE